MRKALAAMAIGAAALGLGATAARAQGATGSGGSSATPSCSGCRAPALTESERQRVEQVRRDLERAVERARDRLGELREDSDYRETEAQAMRKAYIALENAEPATPEFAMMLAQLEALRAEQQPRFLEDQRLKNALKEATRLQQEFVLRQSASRRSRGYLGVTFSSNRTVDRAGRISFTVDDYPTILSVEPDSPAREAGVKSGDVLLALNGRDVVKQGPIPLSEMLTPGQTVKLRVLRNKKKLELPVRVGAALQTQVYVARPAQAPTAIYSPGERMIAIAPPAPAPGVRVMPVPPVEGPEMSRFVWTMDGNTFLGSAMFGAQFTTMDRDYRERLHVDDGVVVLRVQPNSIADGAGLHGLDVIVKVDGLTVTSPDDMRAAIRRAQQSGADSVVVMVVGDKNAKRNVTLRWRN